MPARIGAYKFAGNSHELICVKEIPDNEQLRPGDEMILCFGEDPKTTWDAIVALVDMPHNNGYCTVAVIETNVKKGIRCPEENIFLQIEKRKLFIPKSFLKKEEKK